MSHAVLVDRQELPNARIATRDLPPLPDGTVRLKVESFAVTSNNVTYAVAGDRFGYWNFFPADNEEGTQWGIVPMWGHAMVEDSAHLDFETGERVYGYLPMATHLTIVPDDVSPRGFTDGAPHRQPMSPIYNQYTRLSHDAEHDPDKEAERMIFGPLFKTGFLIESMFRRENWFGAEAVVLTSASSKTAMGLASVAKDRSPDIARVGLTSRGNVGFVESTGLYTRVLAYDDIGQLEHRPSVSVDFAGNADLLRQVHDHYGDTLRYSCLVGVTHVQAQSEGESDGDRHADGGGTKSMPGPEPLLFFAPDHAVAAVKEMGAKAFSEDVAASWHRFLNDVDGTVRVATRDGIEAARDAYLALLSGKVDPAEGIVIRP
ncbi:MAG: DUF2855 family protein [Pontixanthobacter sp.]